MGIPGQQPGGRRSAPSYRRASYHTSGADSRAAPRGASARAAGGAAVVLEGLADRGAGVLRAASRPASRLVHRPEPTDPTSPMRPLVVDQCRPSFAVAFEHRLVHRAQGRGVRPPAAGADAVRGPRSASGSLGLARPGAEPTRRPAASPPPAPPPRPRRRGRCLTASRGGRCPPRGPPTVRGHPRAGSSRRERPSSRKRPDRSPAVSSGTLTQWSRASMRRWCVFT